MSTLQTALIIIGVIVILALVIYLFRKPLIKLFRKLFNILDKYYYVPIRDLGLTEMPAVPFNAVETLETILKLQLRAGENKMAKGGLTNTYTIKGETQGAYAFLYDDESLDGDSEAYDELYKKLDTTKPKFPLNAEEFKNHIAANSFPSEAPKGRTLNTLFLDKPEQFSISWTNYYNIYKNSEHLEDQYASILTDADEASKQFWPMIAENGLAYNLLFIEKVQDESSQKVKEVFHKEWENHLESIYKDGALYAIDLRIFNNWEAQKVHGYDRWTPGAFILLKQNKSNKTFMPIAVQVSGAENDTSQIYTREETTDEAWIFAMAAARTAVTVYGIWLGHVYHWHVVTAAMQITLFNNVKQEHDLRKFLDPQCQSLIGFNDTLFLLWKKIGPPTSFASTLQFLELTNTFATGREFFDDDPKVALKNLGLSKEDFSYKSDWDRYPIVKDLLDIWDICEEMVDVFVETTYKSDSAVAKDKQLQKWINASSNPEEGNIRGLPVVKSKEELKRVLTSIIYRITAHGNSRMMRSLGPGLSFVANYPPCLQYNKLVKPDEKPDIKEILRYLPNTGTIGEMMTFYYIFIFSAPYEPLLPLFGNDENLYFKNPSDPRNQALMVFRRRIGEFIKRYDLKAPLIHQWPASIET